MKKLFLLTLFLSLFGLSMSAQDEVLVISSENGEYLENYENHEFYPDFKDYRQGGIITIKGKRNDGQQAQIQVIDDSNGWSQFYSNYDIWTDEVSFELTGEMISKIIGDKIVIQGKNFTFYSLYYKAPEGGVEYVEVPLIDPINRYYENWDAEPYFVFFEGLQVGGKVNIYLHGHQAQRYYINKDKHSVQVDGSQFVDKRDYDTFDNWYETDPPSNYSFYVTESNVDVLNNGGICINGDNFTLRKITYTYSGEEQSPRAWEAPNGNEPEDFVDELKVDLLSRVQNLSFINGHWKNIESVEKADDKVTVKTTAENQGFGVTSVALAKWAEENNSGAKLGNDNYNGIGSELSDYGKNTKAGETNKDALLDFNRFQYAVISLDQPVSGARVVVYYRDLDWDNYDDPEEDELPEYVEFGGSTQTFKVELTPYRYVRAIALRVPDAGTYNVTEFFLYEYEDYAELKARTDGDETVGEGLKLAMEIWHPADESGDTLYEGFHLGYKRLQDENDGTDFNCNEGEQLAWTQAIEMSPDNLNGVISDNISDKYPAFAIVYKNAERVYGKNDMSTPGQMQLYINFPFYRTGSQDYDYARWKDQLWWNSDEEYQDNDTWKNEHLIIDYVNKENEQKAADGSLEDGKDIIYTPNIRNEHTFKTVYAEANVSAGSHYVEIPEGNHDTYNYCYVYLNSNSKLSFPKYESGNGMDKYGAPRRANEQPEIGTSTGNILDEIKKNGLAIRGQNVSVMKVVYLGDVSYIEPDVVEREEATGVEEIIGEENVTESAVVTVYNMQGMAVRRNVERADALTGLAKGIYIVGGKKIIVNY